MEYGKKILLYKSKVVFDKVALSYFKEKRNRVLAGNKKCIETGKRVDKKNRA
jgi:hypothetical protein